MTDFVQYVFAGSALGARYALVALGFVVIFRATGVINFAQGGLVAVGAYLTYQLAEESGLPFALAVVMAVALCGLLGALIERLVLARTVGQPAFAVIMITIGLLFVLEQVIPTIWGYGAQNLGDPWGIDTVDAAGLTLAVRDLWTLLLAAVALAGFFAFFQRSRYGLAMRAVAIDQEAALAQGISVRRVVAVSWAISGMVAALAGVTLATGAAAVTPTISFIALAAFPAMILGGLDSPGGAVVGGLLIGITQTLTAGYQPDHAAWLGDNFHVVMPYVVMILILLVRPYGLFGSREVDRA
ncbi:branched-chain amino acid ABC transporter permease [Conexibacter sp. W3-3-2]|uniref:branched-chain amino acid ABC transporter permease n=1 Tax=Conexibacter sp. W3-3-2 TaxID=2675227 RepID=UPI0012B8E0B0|nr:branched-chain amino acid ABC transporter permease [Conexibacter sp. W3-3-2]MTD44485.1 branched-chain amino acid ABC transporter permease [Conexibacter sp. W3-3-2]